MCECRKEMWRFLIQVATKRFAFKVLNFLILLSSFGGKRPPTSQVHDGVLLKLFKKRIALPSKRNAKYCGRKSYEPGRYHPDRYDSVLNCPR